MGDYDNDGDLDILLAGESSEGFSTRICGIYRNDGNGTFTDINAGFLGTSGGSVAWVDFDNDGDLDAFTTGLVATQLYRNNRGVFTPVPTILPILIKGKAVWGDYDNDGDKDLFITGDLGGSSKIARIYRNEGGGNFAATAVNLATGYDSSAAWGDYDQDGDLDLGTTGGDRDTGFPQIYRNDGNNLFASIPTSFPSGESGSAAWADFDNDGNLDFTFTGLNSNAATVTCLFLNRGSNQFNLLNTPQVRGVWDGETTWADFDNDGDVDLLVSGYQIGVSSVFELYRNDGAMPNSPPAAPANLGFATVGGNVVLSWNAPTDLNQSGGFSYNLRMGTSPGAINVISPMADPNTGFRRVAAMGNAGQHLSWTITNLSAGTYYWSVQAIDNSFAGSPFSAEQSFTLSAPMILSHPKDLTIINGQDAFFVVTAKGTQPMQYQLRFNGKDMLWRSVTGGTNWNFIISGSQSPQQGNYSIAVSNAFGSAVSSNAFLTVLHPPSFPQQPQNQSRALGGVANFSASVSGSDPFNFQWFFDGVALTNGGRISGANTLSLVITNLQFTDAGNYSLRASSNAGVSNSLSASLTVLAPVTITQPPKNQTALAGSNAQFSVVADGGGAIGYQWNFNGQPLLNGGRISGAQSPTLTISNLLLGDAGNYSVLVTNEVSSLLISNAILTVIAPPTFTQQPTNQNIITGGNAHFSVDASGTLPISYQWFFNDAPLMDGGRVSGATNKILSIAITQIDDAGNYFVVASNVAGSVTSLVASLDVGLPPSITLPPSSQTNLAFSNATFVVVADGTAPLNYQWQFNGTNLLDDNRISGSTTPALVISNLQTSFAGNYSVVVTNMFGSVTSASAALTVLVPPIFNAQPASRSVPVGMPTTFSASVTGTAPLTYQWQFNGSNILNATNSSFSIASVTTNDFGIYTLTASNDVGVVTSAEALLTPGKIVAWGRSDYGQTVVPVDLTNVVMLAAGGIGGNPGHSLALRTDGLVVAWGYNSFGQTNVPAGLSNIVAIAAGGTHSLALRSDGKVFGWGNNSVGQINIPVTVSNIVAIAAGGTHSMALRSDGKILAWGNSSYGLNNVTSFPANFTAIGCGQYNSLAIRNDGSLAIWGNNSYGQTNPPAGVRDVAGIAGGYYHAAVLRSNGTVVVWGNNAASLTNVPVSLTNGIMITAGDYFSAALRSNGTVIVWGQNNYGISNVPTAASNLISISGGATHLLGLIGDDAPLIVQQPIGGANFLGREATLRGKAIGAMPLNYQWQFNGADIPDATNATLRLLALDATNAGNYQLVVSNAFGVATSVPAPLTVLNNPGLTILAQPPAIQTNYQGSKVALNFSVAGNGPLKYQWRLNGTNIVGATNQEFVFDPVLFENAGNYSAIISNQFGSVTSGTLTQRVQTIRTWGYSGDYYSYFYSQNPIVTNVVSVAAGPSHFLALRDDGKIQGWGINQFGEINPPAALSNVTIKAIAAGYNFSLALRSDGTPFAWGYNSYGQTNIPASATNVIAIASGVLHSLALRSDGSAVSWGNNSYGQTNVPAGATNLIAVAAGQYHSLGLKADGTIIAWGHLGYGLSGMPRDATNLIAVAAGSIHSLALRTNGTVIAWGANTGGQTNVPAGLSNVVAISASGMHSVALRADGTVVHWGSYFSGGGANISPTTPSDLENFIQVADGGDRSIGLLGTRAPAITIQPFNRVVLSGSNTVLIAKAVGAQPVSYQWLFNGANIFGATNDSLVLTNVQFSEAGAYQLSVSNNYGTSVSKPAKLVVSLPLSEALDATNFAWSSPGAEQWIGQISTTHDEADAARSGSISHNQNSVLQTSVTGPAQISFWWKVSSETVFDALEFRLNGAVRAVISGEEDWQQQTFSIPAGSNTLQWRYAKDASSSVGQDAGWVDQFAYVPAPPIITLQPVGKTVKMGANVQFIVTATGVGPFDYQWRKDVTNAVGINSATLVLTNVSRAHGGIYSLTISNAGGSVTSSNAILNVLVPQRLETPSIQPDGTLLIAARDADGNPLPNAALGNMQILASTNLLDWTTLPGPLVLTNGNLEFHDPDATNLPKRFYRIIETP